LQAAEVVAVKATKQHEDVAAEVVVLFYLEQYQ